MGRALFRTSISRRVLIAGGWRVHGGGLVLHVLVAGAVAVTAVFGIREKAVHRMSAEQLEERSTFDGLQKGDALRRGKRGTTGGAREHGGPLRGEVVEARFV